MVRYLGVAEAVVALIIARSALRLLPIRWLASASAPTSDGSPAGGALDARAAHVGRAIGSAASRLPWHSSCLVRALAARIMLARRRMPSVLYLGVAKQSGEIRAHAWLLAGGGVVCGGSEASDYTPIAALLSRRIS